MDSSLLDRLRVITEEERAILDGHSPVQKELYTSSRSFNITAEKLMAKTSLIDIRTHTRFAPFPNHRHDYVEIMYMCSGRTTHVFGNEKVTLNTGELLFLGRNSWHEILPAGENDIGVNFIIRPQFFHTALDMMEEQNILSDFIVSCLTGGGESGDYMHFAVSDVPAVQNLVENMIHSLLGNPRKSSRINEITMGLLFLQLMECADKAEMGGGEPRALALRALVYINSHYSTATLTEFAAQNNLPDYTASRIIKNQLGASFKELLREKRFSVAVGMLKDTGLPVARIISAVGYENTSYFHRMFQDKYGMTPKEYRGK